MMVEDVASYNATVVELLFCVLLVWQRVLGGLSRHCGIGQCEVSACEKGALVCKFGNVRVLAFPSLVNQLRHCCHDEVDSQDSERAKGSQWPPRGFGGLPDTVPAGRLHAGTLHRLLRLRCPRSVRRRLYLVAAALGVRKVLKGRPLRITLVRPCHHSCQDETRSDRP